MKVYNKRLCPFCFEEFYPGECRIISMMDGRLLKEEPQGWHKHIARIRPVFPLTGSEFTKEFASRECPHCRNLLPFNIEQVRAVNIAIVGDAFSGKSSYIAALMHQLVKGQWMSQDYYIRVSCLNGDLLRAYDTFLFDHERFRPSSSMEPLIFELSMSKSPKELPESVNLIFYDTTNAGFQTPEEMIRYNRCLLNADALVFLIEPEAIPGFAPRLPHHLRRQEQRASSNPFDYLQRLARLNTNEKLLSLPVAVTISKSDLLRYIMPLNSSASFMDNCAYDNAVTIQNIEENGKRLQDLLRELGADTLLSTAQDLPDVSFFAVSATGHPVNEQGLYPAIEPCRCLDPLLWILHKLDIMSLNDSSYTSTNWLYIGNLITWLWKRIGQFNTR